MRLLLPFSLLFSFTAFASITCGEQTFTSKPVVVSGKFTAGVVAECTIQGPSGSDIRKVSAFLESEIRTEGNILHKEEVAEVQGLPGKLFDVTMFVDEGSVRSDIKVGSDDRDLLIYDSKSKKVNLDGFAGFIEQIDVKINLERTEQDLFKLRLDNFTKVDKPRLVPTSTFRSVALKQHLEQHEKKLRRLAEKIKANL